MLWCRALRFQLKFCSQKFYESILDSATTSLFLFILYLSSDKNMKSKHLEEELKGKSIFVQQKLLLNGSNPLPNKKT